jgi:putative Ig domain-containing protein
MTCRLSPLVAGIPSFIFVAPSQAASPQPLQNCTMAINGKTTISIIAGTGDDIAQYFLEPCDQAGAGSWEISTPFACNSGGAAPCMRWYTFEASGNTSPETYSGSVMWKGTCNGTPNTTLTLPITIIVKPSVKVATTCPLPAGTVQVPYMQELKANGGSGAYSWSLASPMLPPGLALQSSPGRISGIPTTAGQWTFTLCVDDGWGSSDCHANWNDCVLCSISVFPSCQNILNFGTGTPGCKEGHSLWPNGCPNINSPGFELICDRAPANSVGLGIITNMPAAGNDPFGLGIQLDLNLFDSTELYSVTFTSDAHGVGRAGVPIPNNAQLVGKSYFAQAIWLWPSSCAGLSWSLLSSSPALLMSIGG